MSTNTNTNTTYYRPWFLHPCSCICPFPAYIPSISHTSNKEGRPIQESGENEPFFPSTREATLQDGRAPLAPFPLAHHHSSTMCSSSCFTSSNCCCNNNKTTTNKRLYLHEYGIHQPRCGGNCLVAKNVDMLWYTILLLLVPTIIWGIFVANTLRQDMGWYADGAIIILTSLAFLFLFLAWLVEPGILPHRVIRQPVNLPTVTMEDGNNNSLEESFEQHTYVYIYNKYWDMRIFRSMVSKYTFSMIEQFDHYCPFVGNALGKRNYRYFYLFILTIVILAFTVAGTSLIVVLKAMDDHNWAFWNAAWHELGAMTLTVYSTLLGLSLLWLLSYHTRLVVKGVTSIENLKNKFPHGNPHHLGYCGNCCVFWCGPHWESRIATEVNSSSSSNVNPSSSSLQESLLFSPTTPRQDDMINIDEHIDLES
jgi:hypothetical protein